MPQTVLVERTLHTAATKNLDVIDLRSDFLTQPSEAMLRAAYRVRDSHCFGLREDPSQRELERRVADMLGKEDALIFPTCTMANTTAMLLLASPGSKVLTQPGAHVLMSEAGAAAALGGLTMVAVDDASVHADAAAMPSTDAWIRAFSAPSDALRSPVALCVLENTHTHSGGIALKRTFVEEVTRMAKRCGAALHLDGSRLFYARISQKESLASLAQPFDTVSLSLNKAIGSPLPALLAGTGELIARALVVRQRLGGGLRPTGPACAAALAGLDELDQLEGVPALARRLAVGLETCPGIWVPPQPEITNLVIARTSDPSKLYSMVARMDSLGLRAIALDPDRMRLAIYKGINAELVDRAIEIAWRAGRSLQTDSVPNLI